MEAAASFSDPIDFDALKRAVNELGRSVVAPASKAVDDEARFPHEAFDALKGEKLLSAYVPVQYGGMGLSMSQICGLCEILGHHCASTAMVFAMHQIQVACIVHNGGTSTFFQNYMRRIVDEQLLLASATTELGVGGDLTSSLCAVETEGERFTLEKKAPVISYGQEADAILVTARRNPDAQNSDQVHVLVEKDATELEPLAGWDTLGFRGTCSLGFVLKAAGHVEQILPEPFADILAHSMHPYSHMTWGSLWLGLATDAVNIARDSVRKKMLASPGTPPPSALRLAEVDEVLFEMRSGLYATMEEYQEMLDRGNTDAFSNFGFSIRVNNVKITCSELVVDIVGKALLIVGISGYKNDSKSSLSRHLRDAYGAALMVNNDRIRGYNSAMQVIVRQG
ncbi:MAG: acyl-CoA dehydrogenase family protein [Gemmatimonadota bacterium]